MSCGDIFLLMVQTQRYFIVIIQQHIIYMSRTNQTFKIIIYIFIVFISVNTYFTSPLNLYVSDQNYTKIFNDVGKQNSKMIGIIFTNKFCKNCYMEQEILFQIINKVWKQYRIKIYRSQLGVNQQLQEFFKIKRFPMIHFVVTYGNDIIPYETNDIVTLKTVKSTINRLQYTLKPYQLSQNQSRYIVFIDESLLMFSQQQQIKRQFSLNPVYQNLPKLVFSSTKKVKEILALDDVIESDRINCAIYWRSNKKCFSLNSLEEVHYLFSMINYQQVIQFKQATYKNYQQLILNRITFVAVLDSIFNREESQKHIEMLNKILQKRQFHSKITIFWMQTQINKLKLTHLGFKQTDRAPLFALFNQANIAKNILTDEKGNPIFSEQAVTEFIKRLLNIDEERQKSLWNQQLLNQSLQKLKISKGYKLISPNSFKIDKKCYFILSFPLIQPVLLGQPQIFYKMILNYRYMIERINRFIDHSIQINYLTFDKYKCQNKPTNGFFYIQANKCHVISQKVIFQQQQTAKVLQKIFNLPNFFWINQDHYQQYLNEHSEDIKINDFKYIYI